MAVICSRCGPEDGLRARFLPNCTPLHTVIMAYAAHKRTSADADTGDPKRQKLEVCPFPVASIGCMQHPPALSRTEAMMLLGISPMQ